MIIEASPQQATGNLPSKEFRLFLFRSLTPQQATRNALALLVQPLRESYHAKIVKLCSNYAIGLVFINVG